MLLFTLALKYKSLAIEHASCEVGKEKRTLTHNGRYTRVQFQNAYIQSCSTSKWYIKTVEKLTISGDFWRYRCLSLFG